MADLDDTTLVAFVDGELDPAAARAVAEQLAADPAAEEKVRLFRTSASLVRRAFAQPEWEQVPPPLARLVERPRLGLLAGRRQFGAALAALAACAVGVAGGFGIERALTPHPSPAEQLLDEVAEYHTVYAGDAGGLDFAPAREASRIETWFSDVLGRPVRIPDLAAFGLAFAGARLLVIDGRPVAQLLYALPGQPRRPLGVCIAAWSGADRALSTGRRNGVDLALWAHAGYAYVLVGWIDRSRLSRLAASLRPTLEGA